MAKTFNNITEAEEGTYLIVDSLNLAFRYKHKQAINFLEDYIRTVDSLKKSYKASQVVILSDWGSSTYRKEIYPEYKQNRAELREKQSPEEAEYFEKFFEEYLRIVDHYKNNTKYLTFRFKGVEADDIAAHIVKYKCNYNIKNIWLISSDKDWDLLIQDNVSRFSYVTRKEITIDNWDTHYSITPEEYISSKCLQGDAGDNVPGIPQIGPKRSESLIKQYGSALDLADAIPLSGKYAYIKNINEFGADNIMRNYQLMDLLSFCDDAIGIENIKEIENEFNK